MPLSPTARTGLLAFGIVGGLVVVMAGIGVGAYLLTGRSGSAMGGGSGSGGSGGGPGLVAGKPSPDRDGESWTVAELLTHLSSHGVKLSQQGGGEQQADALVVECRTDRGTYMSIYHHRDARTARDLAGVNREWAWGRFRFRAGQELLSQIRAALGA